VLGVGARVRVQPLKQEPVKEMAEERVKANACLLLVISAHAAAGHAKYTTINTTRERSMAPKKKMALKNEKKQKFFSF